MDLWNLGRTSGLMHIDCVMVIPAESRAKVHVCDSTTIRLFATPPLVQPW